MVYSELPTLSSLSSRAWARQEPLSHLSRWNLSSYDSSISLPLSPLSALFSCGPGRDRVRVGLPGLITLITLPVKVDHREKREERMGERRAECEQRSAVRECGPAPGAASCDLAAIIWVTHSHTGGSPWALDFPVATHRWRRGQVSAWVTHVAIAGPGRPGICRGYVTRVKTGADPARAPTHARHNLSNA